MKICFLLTHVPDPKTNKRIAALKTIGEVSVVCMRRKNQDIWEPLFKDVKHHIYDLDIPTAQHVVRRYLKSRNYQKKALEQLERIEPDLIYAEGLDSLLIIKKYEKYRDVKVVYDVADLRETYIEKPKNIFRRFIAIIVRKIESYSFKVVDWLIITSPKFYDVHYKNLIGKEKVLYIPNIPDKDVFTEYRKKDKGEFTIGFIGGIRYLKQMKMLVDAAEYCECKVLFAGAGGTKEEYHEITEYCKTKKYINFTGKYNYDKEIAQLYSRVDCVYAVYDADNPNVKIALPNKLYESILCELPIIVAKGTYLAEIVNKLGVGSEVNHIEINDLISVINQLKRKDELYIKLVNNCKKIQEQIDLDIYNMRLQKIVIDLLEKN